MHPQFYTPSLSEFRIGFEFEMLCSGGKLISGGDWVEWNAYTFDTDWSLEKISDELEEGNIRVKRLDADDIVECGWVYSESFKSSQLFVMDGKPVKLLYCPDISLITIMIFYQTAFTGVIRNKSELLDQMQRCGIEAK